MHMSQSFAGMVIALFSCSPAHGQSESGLAKQAQNPIANLITLPFQNNANFDFGPDERTQNVLNIGKFVTQLRLFISEIDRCLIVHPGQRDDLTANQTS